MAFSSGRGQAAVEYMALVVFSLAALFVIWVYVDSSKQTVEQELRVGFARQTVDRLSDAVRQVYVQGPPARIFVDVNLPDGVVRAVPSGSTACNVTEILLEVAALDGARSEVYRPLPTNVSGDVSFLAGRSGGVSRVSVEATYVGGQPCVVLSG